MGKFTGEQAKGISEKCDVFARTDGTDDCYAICSAAPEDIADGAEEIMQWKKDIIQAPRGGYELVRIPGGEFLMGSPNWEKGRFDDEGPQHRVHVPEFYMGRYPVTNEEYGRYLSENSGAEVPAHWGNRGHNHPHKPVVSMSWEDAKQYARWAGLRLPSEAQWEYACRAGTKTRFHSGNTDADLYRAGWFNKKSGDNHHPAGEKYPNDFGLHDMHGNVLEWVEDDWHNDYKGAPFDGSAWIDKPRATLRVFRGGGWGNSAESCRAAIRGRLDPDARFGGLGFRLVHLPGQQAAQ